MPQMFLNSAPLNLVLWSEVPRRMSRCRAPNDVWTLSKFGRVRYIFELRGWGKKLECKNLVLLELYKRPLSIYAY